MICKICPTCDKEFPKLKSTSKRVWGKQQYCSIKCSGTLIKKGEYPDRLRAGTEDRYKRLHEQKQQGVLHNNWKGGISYAFVKKEALKRDDFTCQNCGLREPEIMEVDHIKKKSDYPELSKTLSNLVTLCPNCHRRKTNIELKQKGQNARLQMFLPEDITRGY